MAQRINSGQSYIDAINTFPFDITQTANLNSNEDLYYIHYLRYGLIRGIHYLRIGLIRGIHYLVQNDKMAAAKDLYRKLTVAIPLEKFPYESEDLQQYMDKVAELMK